MRIKKDVYSTWCSQAVTHLSTDHARRCLTSVIGREPVFSTWYGRRHSNAEVKRYIANTLLFSHKNRFNQVMVAFQSLPPSLTGPLT